MLSTGGTPASAHSSIQIELCSGVRPRPPYSTGQWMPAKPAASICPVPGDALLDQIGWADRAVVARCAVTVGGEPGARLELEVVDGDHRRRRYRPLSMSFEAIFPAQRPEVLAAGERARVVVDDALRCLRESCTGEGPIGQLVTWAWTVDVDRTHALLVHHGRYGHWMPAGGRCGADEHPSAAAVRELHEESGLAGTLLDPHPLLLDVVIDDLEDLGGVQARAFGMAFVVVADRTAPLTAEPDQPAAWFPLGPAAPEGASVRHWERMMRGFASVAETPRAHP